MFKILSHAARASLNNQWSDIRRWKGSTNASFFHRDDDNDDIGGAAEPWTIYLYKYNIYVYIYCNRFFICACSIVSVGALLIFCRRRLP